MSICMYVNQFTFGYKSITVLTPKILNYIPTSIKELRYLQKIPNIKKIIMVHMQKQFNEARYLNLITMMISNLNPRDLTEGEGLYLNYKFESLLNSFC